MENILTNQKMIIILNGYTSKWIEVLTVEWSSRDPVYRY